MVAINEIPLSRLGNGGRRGRVPACAVGSGRTSGTTTQTESANAQNQITSISGSATPTYDANGNMISDQNGNTYVYDAWNRLVEVKNAAGAVIAQYTYDARGYRVTESYPQGGSGVPAGTTNYIYYDANWQVIETRTNGTAASNVTSQMVWSAAYINSAVLQDSYSGGVIQPNSRLYFTQDANWDTTAVIGYNSITQTWGVVQRYVYSPYGTITVLNADWSTPPTGTQPLVNNLYQGMALDAVTGLYYERARDYSPSLGRWKEQDPAQFINGANTYQFVEGSPVGNVDTEGLAASGGWLSYHDIGGTTYWANTQTGAISYSYPTGQMAPVGGPPQIPSVGGFAPLPNALGQTIWYGPNGQTTGLPGQNGAAWDDDAYLFWNFISGTGPQTINFGPSSVETKQMEQSPGVALAMARFKSINQNAVCCKDLKQLRNYLYKFTASDIAGSNATENFVGSYMVNIFPNDPRDGQLKFVITNRTSSWSFLYHSALVQPYPRSAFGPMGNIYQTFAFYRPYLCEH